MENKSYYINYGRREFLTSVTKLASASMVLAVPGVSIAGGLWKTKTTFIN
ncbi:hypothetical protein OCK74_16435 [Chitinophagaceae bacterium LB-8]|uniref:Uncharacterized protein n=1 Tax=Paraflavisolibacter caeni TaxID=2982496 RepID=A0A9X2XXV5_9BACT|nr:hypothetical protein [Paraflavisolibacter caeni]MCU7550707.1 hypothetical protein [Paraflavisolibacter caeni]